MISILIFQSIFQKDLIVRCIALITEEKKSILLSLNLFSNLSKRISNLLLISKAFLEFLESKSKQQLLVEVSYYDQIKKWLLHYILSFNSNHWKKGNLIKYSRDSLNDYSSAAFQSEFKTICLWCFIYQIINSDWKNPANNIWKDLAPKCLATIHLQYWSHKCEREGEKNLLDVLSFIS